MSQMQSLMLVVSAVCLHGIGSAEEFCKDYGIQFERVYTVPGDAAALNCTLASPDVFDVHSTPYNISWYEWRSGRELSGGLGRIWDRETMLWFLSSTLEDSGHYECVLRTPNTCFKQVSVLIVNATELGDCNRPYTAAQTLTVIANGYLVCPLLTYMDHVDSYYFEWYKDCEPILEGDKYGFVNKNALLVREVSPSDKGYYTCRMIFNLTGTIGYTAETIDCQIIDKWILRPFVSEPANDTIRTDYGAPFNKTCRVFVPSKGSHRVDVFWATEEEFISLDPSDRVYQLTQSKKKVPDGEWLEVSLNFTVVQEEDFNTNYTCLVFSDKGILSSYFHLRPSDPNLIVPLVLLFTGLALTFLISVAVYRVFKIDIVLWCRSYFPYVYTDPGSDGKIYDAYVVYPRMCLGGSTGSAETFALHTLPHVLERNCGYRLFIFGRDSLPGEAIVDSIQENISKSRRLLLLYTASTFSKPEASLLFEQQVGTHSALVEETLQVILVELEEIRDSSVLPESVLHLKRKQGAVQWWRACAKDTERSLLCPSSRFWKQVRYRMPVKSIPASCLEKNTLLNF
ncbi:hypothetical protein MATL_G00151490 [Megalops atlanticus]|uniref:Interleukin-1 receptor type 1-like n=1 Tax=Megalops atlanticus TaxID=7932 RepID=A0A9D3TA20_MEGAT|nr:hypothetical protein MATL_G00151490 [Megalops atlanticus]